jgi:AcrR family transcriptional regulator
MGRTPKTVPDRRGRILEAALRLFADKGFDAATNKDIAAAAGITPGFIYHYFKSKRQVLLEALEKHSPLKAFR